MRTPSMSDLSSLSVSVSQPQTTNHERRSFLSCDRQLFLNDRWGADPSVAFTFQPVTIVFTLKRFDAVCELFAISQNLSHSTRTSPPVKSKELRNNPTTTPHPIRFNNHDLSSRDYRHLCRHELTRRPSRISSRCRRPRLSQNATFEELPCLD
jgi:hypothetical protein